MPYPINSANTLFGPLTKIDSMPVRWRWVINGKEIELTTSQLASYPMLKQKCLRYALRRDPRFLSGISWPEMNKDQWRQYLNNALAPLRESIS